MSEQTKKGVLAVRDNAPSGHDRGGKGIPMSLCPAL